MIVLTPGDPDGVGPEITWKILKSANASAHSSSHFSAKKTAILCVGARKPFDEMGAKVVLVTETELRKGATPPRLSEPFVWLLAAPTKTPKPFGGKKNPLLEGYQSGWSIEKATGLVLKGTAQAIVTGPISKERLQKGGYIYPGHTEFLADLCKTPGKPKSKSKKAIPEIIPEVTMMLANDQLRVSLVTTHLGIKGVSKALTRAKIRRAVTQTVEHLQNWWRIEKPRVAVAALNPHAGEAGLFGKEEIKIITPEIEALKKTFGNRAEISGPTPADTLFAKNHLADDRDKFDAVVCMYHDQGLIPVKLLDFRRTVNVTLGLPIVRTSVDHGVGFDIAKTGKADPSSLQSAVDLALQIVGSRSS
jgi:4-hydroxythreonine-4-phosphate dehydrogenase